MNAFHMVRLMRPQQWTKNLFVFAPVVFSFKLLDLHAVAESLVAIAVFCLCASAIYALNDLRDIDADKKHPDKRARPLASGAVTPPQAAALLVVLLSIAAAILAFAGLGKTFLGFFLIYIALNCGYSFGLKHVALLELFIIASGYVLRIMAGCAAIHETASPWIIAATGMAALLIVTGKRRAEIAENKDPERQRQSLKEYNLTFLDSVITMMAATTVMTYLLFTMSDYALARYHAPYFNSTAIFVLYGVLRYMQLIKVMSGAADPTTLVLSDRSLRVTIIGWLVLCIGLIYFK